VVTVGNTASRSTPVNCNQLAMTVRTQPHLTVGTVDLVTDLAVVTLAVMEPMVMVLMVTVTIDQVLTGVTLMSLAINIDHLLSTTSYKRNGHRALF